MKTRFITALVAAAMLLLFTEARADHTNTNGTNVLTCDLSDLEDLLEDLDESDIEAPNENAARGRLGSLLNALDAAIDGAQDGDADELEDARFLISQACLGSFTMQSVAIERICAWSRHATGGP